MVLAGLYKDQIPFEERKTSPGFYINCVDIFLTSYDVDTFFRTSVDLLFIFYCCVL